ncbi:MAG: efflux transporter outer membrane subunit [Gammaproteobacteria bacterium]|nr:efflux transporter outer membrane subunit [Gammaproteobacteria bacterium]
MAPDYQTPVIATPAQFAGYEVLKPIEQLRQTPHSSAWWQAFNDPLLNELNERLTLDNQTLKASEAQYRMALATLQSVSASRLPTLNSNFSASHGTLASTTSFSSSELPKVTTYSLSANVAWELDVWGRIRANISSNEAKAQASLADLYAARLSTQALLTQSYLQLRHLDYQQQLLAESETAYQRFLALTQARIKAGVASKLDATQAETQLYSVQAQLLDLRDQRQRLQNAIASLIGTHSAALSISKKADYAFSIPETPRLIPSALLTQRPDIIASERRVYAANQQIGVAQSAFFPSINLVASASYRNRDLANLIDIPNTFWSLGPSMALALFDGGLREANKAIAIATMEQAAANYKQTLLTAFQEVEDNLSSLYWLAQEAKIQQQAVSSANQALLIAQKQYQAGINSALNVISAQTAELTAKRTLADIQHRQRLAAVQLWKNTATGISPADEQQKSPSNS